MTLFHLIILAIRFGLMVLILLILIASCAIWLWNMVSYVKGGMQLKGIWKQDPEENIWAQEGWEWGVEKAPQLGTS